MIPPEFDEALAACGGTAEQVRKVGEGLWSDVYALGDETVLKLVRREAGVGDGIALWRAECAALLAVDEADLPVAVPALIDSDLFRPGGAASEAGFGAWMRTAAIPGRALDDDKIEGMPEERRQRLAGELGRALAVLHAHGRELALPDLQREADLADLETVAVATRDIAPDGLLETIRQNIEDLADDPAVVACHGDLNSTNLMSDGNGSLTGLIDWAEARYEWREGEFCHLMLMPAFFADVRRVYEEAAQVRLDENRLRLCAWHNLLVTIAIARSRNDLEDEARALGWTQKIPLPE